MDSGLRRFATTNGLESCSLRSELEAENETATAQRLGYLLERANLKKLATVVATWLPSKLPAIPLAVGSAKRDATVSAPWRVIDNSGEFTP